MEEPTFSVVVPLYNKRAEVQHTLRSVLAQTRPPLEIVVVDDGSTDGSAEAVEAMASPLVRLIRQPNAGSAAARNRGVEASKGRYIAFLDADDRWEPDYLEQIARLIAAWPGCGAYCSAFNIIAPDGIFPANSPEREGVIDNYFEEAMHRYLCITSATTVPREVFERIGGFPEGMRMGQDTYMWIKIARACPVAYTPLRLCNYSKVAQNRTPSLWRGDDTQASFRDFYTGGRDAALDEYAARIALTRALVVSAKGGTREARETARFFSYTRRNRLALRKLQLLNMLPARWRAAALSAYNALAWKIARRGL